MKVISGIIVLFQIVVFLTIHASNAAASGDILFIGHAYGTHEGKAVPYPPLEKFLSKNKLPIIRVWGGDLTQDPGRFSEFAEYLNTLGGVNLLVRGNHDGSILWAKTPYWTDYVTSNNIWIHNLDMNEDMKFTEIPLKPMVVASHYAYFNELFQPYKIPNSMYGVKDRDLSSDNLIVKKTRILIAGDCGAFRSLEAGYAQVDLGKNKFICTGMGAGKGFDNVVSINGSGNASPIFFDSSGEVLSTICRVVPSNSQYKNAVKLCFAN